MVMTDPLCIKLNDLIRRGKIPKDKILYLSDVVEIMSNPNPSMNMIVRL